MFRENKDHLQEQLFNSRSTMDAKTLQRLQNTWSPIMYFAK